VSGRASSRQCRCSKLRHLKSLCVQVKLSDFSRYLRSVGDRLEAFERSREATQQRLHNALSPGACVSVWGVWRVGWGGACERKQEATQQRRHFAAPISAACTPPLLSRWPAPHHCFPAGLPTGLPALLPCPTLPYPTLKFPALMPLACAPCSSVWHLILQRSCGPARGRAWWLPCARCPPPSFRRALTWTRASCGRSWCR